MASVKDTVYSMLVRHPLSFQSKSDCFKSLFLLTGNGMEWVDGELVLPDEPLCMEPRYRDEETEVAKETCDLIHDAIRRNVRLDNARVRFALENFDLLFHEEVSFKRLGWVSDRCRLFNAPEKLNEDWEQALNETSLALLMRIKDMRHMDKLNDLDDITLMTLKVRQRWAAADRQLSDMITQILAETEEKDAAP